MSNEESEYTEQPQVEENENSMSVENPDSKEMEKKETEKEVTEKEDTEPPICRDFWKGRCTRPSCKFKHDRNAPLPGSKVVCKDYQASRCHRDKCKFLHLTVEEEEEFKSTGVMPERKSSNSVSAGGEVCRDFINGFCRRGNGCKYIHQQAQISNNFDQISSLGKRPFGVVGSDPMYNKRQSMSLEQENEALKREVLELRSKVLQLQQQNDALLNKDKSITNYQWNDRSLLPNPPQNGYRY